MAYVGFALLLSCLLYMSNGQETEMHLEKNDSCTNISGTCTKLRNCPSAITAIKRGERPRICSFEDKEPVVCCPRNITISADDKGDIREEQITTKSAKMCEYYSQILCNPPQFEWGGIPARPKEFPHMALIGYGEDPDKISWQCGGSLISERYVLSAAHCTLPSTTIGPANYVRVGDLNTATDSDDAEPQQFKIVERMNHPEYKPPEVYNDIALYRLDTEAVFSPHVRPLCLYGNFTSPKHRVVSTGWGRISFAGPVSPELLKVTIRLFDENECKRLLNSTSAQLPLGIDGNTMVCAGERDGSRDSCQGDSGGPLTLHIDHQQWCLAEQLGITSFGRMCGLADSPGIYTRVAPYIPWIESIVWPEEI